LGSFGVGERIILKWILEKQGVDWIKLAQARVQWRTIVNMIMNLLVT